MRDLLWGCNSLWNSSIINHCLRETSSYLCFPLWWVIPTETGWPTWSSAVSLIDRSYAPGGLQWLKNKKKKRIDLLFKPEPGQFVLWLSRQWSALNPYEDCAAQGPGWTPNHTVKMRTCPVSRLRRRCGAPCEKCAWHLIFLTMKDDNGVADANFFRWRKMCRALSPAQSVLDYHFIQNYDEYLWLILQCENKSKCCGLFGRSLHLIWNTPNIEQYTKSTLLSNFSCLRLSLLVEKSESTLLSLQPLPFHAAPWGGDRDRAVACIHPPAHCNISHSVDMMLPHFTPFASVSHPQEFVNMIRPFNKDLLTGQGGCMWLACPAMSWSVSCLAYWLYMCL